MSKSESWIQLFNNWTSTIQRKIDIPVKYIYLSIYLYVRLTIYLPNKPIQINIQLSENFTNTIPQLYQLFTDPRFRGTLIPRYALWCVFPWHPHLQIRSPMCVSVATSSPDTPSDVCFRDTLSQDTPSDVCFRGTLISRYALWCVCSWHPNPEIHPMMCVFVATLNQRLFSYSIIDQLQFQLLYCCVVQQLNFNYSIIEIQWKRNFS